MAKVKIKSKFAILDFMNRLTGTDMSRTVGTLVVDTAKEMMSEGQSPVRTIGRFAGYSDTYREAIQGKAKYRTGKGGGVYKILPPVVMSKRGVPKATIKTSKKTGKIELNVQREKFAPGLGHDKKVRPINLHLTGDMLDGYAFRATARAVWVGHIKGSTKSKEIAGYHNKGTERMPRRPTVPQAGEEWAVSIMRKIREVYGKRLTDIIRRANKKGAS